MAEHDKNRVVDYDMLGNPITLGDVEKWSPLAAPVQDVAPTDAWQQSLVAVAKYLGIDEATERARPGFDGKGPLSQTIIHAIERKVIAATQAPKARLSTANLRAIAAGESLTAMRNALVNASKEIDHLCAAQPAAQPADAQPFAYLARAQNGNTIIWSVDPATVKAAADKYGRPLEALYLGPATVNDSLTVAVDTQGAARTQDNAS